MHFVHLPVIKNFIFYIFFSNIKNFIVFRNNETEFYKIQNNRINATH